MKADKFLYNWEKINNPFFPSDMRWNKEDLIKLLEDHESHLIPEIDELSDIDTIGKCANCGVEFHIHKEVPEDSTVDLLKDIISWKNDISEYISLEKKLRDKYLITKK
jgi:hypothetical protein